MREWDGQGGKGTKWESNEREILIEEATIGLERNLVLGKFPRICRMTPAKTPSNSGQGTRTSLPL